MGAPADDPAYRVPVAEVEQTIRDACRRWQVAEIIADPFRWTRTLQALEAERLPVVEFPHSPSRLTAATTDLYSAAVNGRITHSGNPILAAHVAAAVDLKTRAGCGWRRRRGPVTPRRSTWPLVWSWHIPAPPGAPRRKPKQDKEFRMTRDELLTTVAAARRAGRPVRRTGPLLHRHPAAGVLSPEAKAALGNRFGVMASNIPRLAVDRAGRAAAHHRIHRRHRPVGGLDPQRPRSDVRGVAHREALLLGDTYVIVWADQFGRPKVTVESAKQVAVQTDPGTRKITAAVKRWETKTTTEAVLYLPDEIVRLRANQTGATITGIQRRRRRSRTRSASSRW